MPPLSKKKKVCLMWKWKSASESVEKNKTYLKIGKKMKKT